MTKLNIWFRFLFFVVHRFSFHVFCFVFFLFFNFLVFISRVALFLLLFEERERERENKSVSKGWGKTIDRHRIATRRKSKTKKTKKTKNDELMIKTRSPCEHPLPTISKNASSLSSAKYAFAHSNHTRNGANSDWRTPRMSSTFVWERLCGSIETCSPLSPIGTWIKEGVWIALTSSPRPRCCCVMTMFPSLAKAKVCNKKWRQNDENAEE